MHSHLFGSAPGLSALHLIMPGAAERHPEGASGSVLHDDSVDIEDEDGRGGRIWDAAKAKLERVERASVDEQVWLLALSYHAIGAQLEVIGQVSELLFRWVNIGFPPPSCYFPLPCLLCLSSPRRIRARYRPCL